MSRLVALAANSVQRTGRCANSIGRPGDSDGRLAVDIRYGGTKNVGLGLIGLGRARRSREFA
jgi:hypothetical protein